MLRLSNIQRLNRSFRECKQYWVANTGGTWSWAGPNGYSSDLNAITILNIQPNQFGTYTATYTSNCMTTNMAQRLIFNLSVNNNSSFILVPQAIINNHYSAPDGGQDYILIGYQ